MPVDTVKERERSSEALKVAAMREEAIVQLFRDGWPMWKIAKVMVHEQIFIENTIRQSVR